LGTNQGSTAGPQDEDPTPEQGPTNLRNALALEATSKQLRSLLHSNARFTEVVVADSQHTVSSPGSSFWLWIAAHGCRTGRLVLRDLELRHSTPLLSAQPGVLQASSVVASAAVVATLEPLSGLVNLAEVVVQDAAPDAADPADAAGAASAGTDASASASAVSLEPLAGLPALESIELRWPALRTQGYAPLCRVTGLKRLDITSHLEDASALEGLSGLSTHLTSAILSGFPAATSLAPLSTLTALQAMTLDGFPSVASLAALTHAHQAAGAAADGRIQQRCS
jgi:hypothetical protein